VPAISKMMIRINFPISFLNLSISKIQKKMEIKAIIFDFNGTLFWDTPLHDKAWDIFLERHKISLTKEQKAQKIHGKTNPDILQGMFETRLTAGEIEGMILEKELIYQQICEGIDMEFAPGAIDFIEICRKKGIHYTIATSSGWENVEFYIRKMKLGLWFDLEKLVYNDYSFRGKPSPDIFIKAFDILKVKPENKLIFEDSQAGIQAAQSSGAKVVIVDSDGGNYEEWNYPVIKDFGEAERFLV
jgi:beta-phosphoglucomutase